ncbi:hypothetical protein, partial [Bacteroides heparinolyticus]|uniref:hypothetical protein n=1 Tax=Prevotella heparinolytica TaxID=28113 RepID=UPI0035A0E1DB
SMPRPVCMEKQHKYWKSKKIAIISCFQSLSLFYWQWKKLNKNIGKNEASYFNINSGTMQFLQQRTKEQGGYDNENNGED